MHDQCIFHKQLLYESIIREKKVSTVCGRLSKHKHCRCIAPPRATRTPFSPEQVIDLKLFHPFTLGGEPYFQPSFCIDHHVLQGSVGRRVDICIAAASKVPIPSPTTTTPSDASLPVCIQSQPLCCLQVLWGTRRHCRDPPCKLCPTPFRWTWKLHSPSLAVQTEIRNRNPASFPVDLV